MSKIETQVKPAQCEHIERIYSREFQLCKETYGYLYPIKIFLTIRIRFLIIITRCSLISIIILNIDHVITIRMFISTSLRQITPRKKMIHNKKLFQIGSPDLRLIIVVCELNVRRL